MTTNDTGETIAFTLELDSLQELFAAPTFDPFSEHCRVESGMDEMANYLRTKSLRPPPRVTTVLVLPAGSVPTDQDGQIQRAIGRYCDLHITQATLVKRARRFEGLSKLGTGLLALPLVAVTIAIISAVTTELPEPVLLFLTPFFTVIIWVAIWNPFDVLLYNRWGENRTIKIYGCIKNTALRIERNPTATSGRGGSG